MNRKQRLLGSLALLLALSGCRVNASNVEKMAEATINEAVITKIAERVNMNKGLISYYLEPSVGRRESNQSNSVFVMYGHEVILNLDVQSIVSRKYYSTGVDQSLREIEAFENMVYEKEGYFTTATSIVRPYRYRLYRISDTDYGILLQTSNLICLGIIPIGDVPNVTMSMFMLLRTVRVDEEAVCSAYSQKELIHYEKETLDIFEKIYPESGEMSEMYDDE